MSIRVECGECVSEWSTPEDLVAHMRLAHDVTSLVHDLHFPTVQEFQKWLSRVEDSRAECSGTVAGCSSDSDSEDLPDGEYYLLCRRRRSFAQKRRRLDSDSAPSSPASSSDAVTCTAFVHVLEHGESGVFVRHCLDHWGHSCAADAPRPSAGLKRTRDGSVCTDSAPSSPAHSIEAELCEAVECLDAFSETSCQVSARLESTADRLRTLTRVLQQLAVDIGASEHRATIVI